MGLSSIRIPVTLMHPKLWRFVGFMSSIVGLVSYALSSSFKLLFGVWNLLKICLYSLAGFIISGIMLFATKRQLSRSFLLKAREGTLVLVLTSFYSFFYDNGVQGKPDILSLVSNGAFALMSLSLSRQTCVGFEVGLFNFFLGCLTVQLMKIKLILALVASPLCYSLILFRSYSDSQLEAAAGIVTIKDHATIWIDSSEEIAERESESATNDPLKELYDNDRIKELFKILWIHKLDKETCITEQAFRMAIDSGFEKECFPVYTIWRRQILESRLQRMGLQKLRSVQAQDLRQKIKRWNEIASYALKTQFPHEQRLSSRFYFGFSDTADQALVEVCGRSTIQLLNFADSILVRFRSANHLSSMLDMYKSLRNVMSYFESLFSNKYGVVLRNDAAAIFKRTVEAIKDIFMEFEDSIRQEVAKELSANKGMLHFAARNLMNYMGVGGAFPLRDAPRVTLHPLTLHVIKYLSVACESWQLLEEVFEGKKPISRYLKLHNRALSSYSSLPVQVARIMESLERILEAKSKIYKNPSLCSVFMMNNWRYIIMEAKHTELGTVLGDDWIRKHAPKVQEHYENYQRSSWMKVVGVLKLDQGSLAMAPNEAAKCMEEMLKMFNLQFERTCRVQSTWTVADEQLRNDIVISVIMMLSYAYKKFINRYLQVVDQGSHANKYVKYEVKDIEALLQKLFQGSPRGAKKMKTWEESNQN